MLKHMLTATTPGPRAQPVDLGLSGPRHHHNHIINHQLHHQGGPLSLRNHHQNSNNINHHNATLSPQQLNLSIQSQRLNHSHALSTLSTSKHSLGNSSSVSPGAGISLHHSHHQPALSLAPQILSTSPPPKLIANGGLHLSRSRIPAAATQVTRLHTARRNSSAGVREMLTSLGLLCLVSLLLALLALIFLLKISPAAEVTPPSRGTSEQTIVSFEEYVVVYEVTLALCALTLSLNLCCLLVCAIQFLFAVKLARAPQGGERTNKYLQKSSVTRVCAVGGFFVSIPVFLTGIILYTFIQFHSTPAIITSVFIGLGIIFCGCAMVHNVFVWQREKTNAVKALAQQQHQLTVAAMSEHTNATSSDRMHLSLRQDTPVSPGSQCMPAATLDLSALVVNPHELSTLV